MAHAENILEVKRRAKVIFGDVYKYPAIPFRSIGRACFKWALDRARFEMVHGTPAERAEREAQNIAAQYQFDVEALHFQCERRRYGSFSTTTEGTNERLAVFTRALRLAEAEQAAHGIGQQEVA